MIDYGSCTTKAGWSYSSQPDLVFRSLISKTKDTKTNSSSSIIATKHKEVDLFKGNFRSPYERNII